MLSQFNVDTDLEPTADQPAAINLLSEHLGNSRFALLKGATGTGKTFVMAHSIAKIGKPTLILSHNKTLAAQLARELRSFMPRNSVELFISYYDSYQPEAYNPKSGTYIAKLAVVNKEIDALRHRATKALVERSDVVTVASVSCIYGLGLPREYLDSVRSFQVGQKASVKEVKTALEELMYERVRSPLDLNLGCYHLANGEFTLWPPYLPAPLKLSVVGNEVCRVTVTDINQIHNDTQLAFPKAEEVISQDGKLIIYPARHHVTPEEQRKEAVARIRAELKERLEELRSAGDHDAALRLETKTEEDLKMIEDVGFCAGVENYSRHLALREAGSPPDTLMAFYDHAYGKDGWMLIVDESHVTLPQLRAMYHGDRKRKESLVQHGFRLPSAFDNRPLTDEEFWEKVGSCIFVSATPSKKELKLVKSKVTEMVIRPTGVKDPAIFTRPTASQLDDLVTLIQERASANEKVLVMAITKRDAEDLADYLVSRSIRCSYLHSGLKTIQRSEVLARLQRNDLDCIVGVNLLREGIDLPQVSLVCIMDADKMGFLRSKSSLLQMVGRAARHVNGSAIFFADSVSPAMEECILETDTRRLKQQSYLEVHNIVPKTAKGRETSSIFEMEKANADDGEVDGADWETITKMVEEHRARGEKTSGLRRTTRYTPEHVEQLRAQVRELPAKTGVYMWKADSAEDSEVLYVGKAKNLKSRVASYLRETAITTRGTRLAAMLSRARSVEVVVTPGGERDALLLESDLIKKYRPLYNVLLRDSRFYPFIVITPQTDKHLPKLITSVRQDHQGARYFGPFTSSAQLRRVVEIIEAAFNLRGLRFQMKFGGHDAREEYLEGVEMATRVLQGDVMAVAEELHKRGRDTSSRLLLALLNGPNEDEQNENAWRRVAENAKAAKELAELLHLPDVPRRIEAYDISHFFGQYTVASRVVFLDGEPARHLFRSYKLEQVNDDFGSIYRAVTKRLSSSESRPDLMVIDGGKGQLSAARSAAADLGIAPDDLSFCALAKQNEELFVPGSLSPVNATSDSPAMLLLRNLRDESHRHAVSKMRFSRRTSHFEEYTKGIQVGQ